MKHEPMRVRRTKTARELGEKFGRSARTIRREIAESREDFLARAATRRERAVELRRAGLKYVEIAETMGISDGSVATLLHHAKKKGEWDGQMDPAPAG